MAIPHHDRTARLSLVPHNANVTSTQPKPLENTGIEEAVDRRAVSIRARGSKERFLVGPDLYGSRFERIHMNHPTTGLRNESPACLLTL